jgi:hypothetical protein
VGGILCVRGILRATAQRLTIPTRDSLLCSTAILANRALDGKARNHCNLIVSLLSFARHSQLPNVNIRIFTLKCLYAIVDHGAEALSSLVISLPHFLSFIWLSCSHYFFS